MSVKFDDVKDTESIENTKDLDDLVQDNCTEDYDDMEDI